MAPPYKPLPLGNPGAASNPLAGVGATLSKLNYGPGGGPQNSPIPLLHPPPAKPAVPKAGTGFRSANLTAPKASKAAPADKHPALPATAGRTSVPARTVTSTAQDGAATVPAKTSTPVASKPPPAAKRASTAAASAPPPPQLTPQQQAMQAVTAALAPLYTQQGTAAQHQNDAIRQFTQAIISQLQGVPSQVQGDYNNAINAQSSLVNSAADALRNANPNTQDQALLSAINAPDAQGQQIAAQNNAVFNGGAAVGQYLNGVSPLGALRSQGLAATDLARLQPGFQGLRGQQALQAALYQQGQARQKIDAMAPGLTQQYTSSLTAAQQKQQYLDMVARKFGYQKAKDQATLNLRVDEFNTRQNTANGKIDVRVSKGFPDGLAHNSSGQVITSGGKPVRFDANTGSVTTRPPSGKDISTLVDKWKGGRTVSKTVRAPNPDANGNPVVKTVKTQQGQLSFEQAYKRLTAMGVADKTARQYLQTAYQRGEQGRGWLTNEQRNILKKSGRQSYVAKYQGHAFITPQMYAALVAAKNPPPGELNHGRYFIAPGY